jgi:hypothetical protein
VRIDSFVFNPEESTSHKALSVTRGVFRYVSAYVASDQNTRIATPAGNLGIRGSVAEGIVDPAVPDFLYLGEGNATFTNSAGSSSLQAGNSIAVPSATTAPMAPDAMPAPVAAQALQAIEKRLPPRSALANRPAADDAWLRRTGAADLVPVSEQRRAIAAMPARPLPTSRGPSGIAGELGLLTEANRLSLFTGRQTTHTPEQTAFLARAAHDNPNAGATMRRFTSDAHAIHSANVTAGTAFVIRGVGHAAPNAEVMHRVTAASTRANPDAAAFITHHANESFHSAEHNEPNRPNKSSAERSSPQKPYVRAPNDYGRRQPSQQRVQQPPQRPQPQRFAPKPPAQPPGKRPPPKKGNEKDQNQQR